MDSGMCMANARTYFVASSPVVSRSARKSGILQGEPNETDGRACSGGIGMRPPPLLRAVKSPALPPPPRVMGSAAPRVAVDAEPRPRTVLRVGRYEVDARLATGGMATVHLGRALGAAGFSRIVAIKRLLPQFAHDHEFESMFVEEAQLAARIRHPNVVPTLDVVSSEGELLLVMEYVAGESIARLTSAARASGDVPQAVALALISDVLHGLHAAHEAKDHHGKPLGIVHRDMSPQNVIVGVDGVARVIDFGIAKAANSVNITSEGMVRGKVGYMAPEQLNCKALTRRTDLYSLGVMLWELLVGARLFPGGARPDLIAKVEGSIPRPRSRVPKLSAKLDEIVMRALATSEADRFGSALEMAQALEDAAPIAARTQIAAWVERHAAAALAERAALVASVEAMAHSVPPPALSAPVSAGLHELLPETLRPPRLPALSSARQQRLRLPWLIGAGAATLLGVFSIALTFRSSRSAEAMPNPAGPALAPTSAAREPIIAPEQPVPLPAPSPEPAAPAAASSAPEPPRTAAEPPQTAPAATPPHPKTSEEQREGTKSLAAKPAKSLPPSANCSPPYTTDAQGRRKYKVECF
jgi:serine/threonine protein kinase